MGAMLAAGCVARRFLCVVRLGIDHTCGRYRVCAYSKQKELTMNTHTTPTIQDIAKASGWDDRDDWELTVFLGGLDFRDMLTFQRLTGRVPTDEEEHDLVHQCLMGITDGADCLYDCETGQTIGTATPKQCRDSWLASRTDGSVGVITVDGERCFVAH